MTPVLTFGSSCDIAYMQLYTQAVCCIFYWYTYISCRPPSKAQIESLVLKLILEKDRLFRFLLRPFCNPSAPCRSSPAVPFPANECEKHEASHAHSQTQVLTSKICFKQQFISHGIASVCKRKHRCFDFQKPAFLTWKFVFHSAPHTW